MLNFQTQRECIEHMCRLVEEAQRHPNLMPVLPTEVRIQGCIYQVEITPDKKIILYSDWDPDNDRPNDSSGSQNVTTNQTQQSPQDFQVAATGTTAVSFLERAKSEEMKQEACDVVSLPCCAQGRPAIDLSHAEPALLRTLEGLSLTAQSRICNQWPLPSSMREVYQDLQDSGTDGEPKPGDKPANIDGICITPNMLKHRKRVFADLSHFKNYVKEVFDGALTAAQAEWMTAGQCTIGHFKLYICWHNKKPHVVSTAKRHFIKIAQPHICKEAKKILAHAMHERFPDTVAEQEGATGYQ